MGVVYPGEAPFPVIDNDPTVSKLLQSFRPNDWTVVGGATAACTVFGYYAGRNSHMHRTSAVMAGFIGVTFGLAVGYQNTLYRHMGLRENNIEWEASKAQ